mmetsp:Transcript_7377/g.13560  ORF Transcript_7377/g.13560 Transcript_7377/m.13560 type:complete len:235 (+) Transcript_7377:180-884(+)
MMIELPSRKPPPRQSSSTKLSAWNRVPPNVPIRRSSGPRCDNRTAMRLRSNASRRRSSLSAFDVLVVIGRLEVRGVDGHRRLVLELLQNNAGDQTGKDRHNEGHAHARQLVARVALVRIGDGQRDEDRHQAAHDGWQAVEVVHAACIVHARLLERVPHVRVADAREKARAEARREGDRRADLQVCDCADGHAAGEGRALDVDDRNHTTVEHSRKSEGHHGGADEGRHGVGDREL